MSLRFRDARFLIVALVLVGVAACGGGSDGDSAGATTTTKAGPDSSVKDSDNASLPGACTVFPLADLEAAFGGALGAREEASVSTHSACTYENGVTTGVSAAQLYDGVVASARSGATSECQDVTGLGDAAVFCVRSRIIGQLFWRDGDLAFDVTGEGADLDTFTRVAATRRG